MPGLTDTQFFERADLMDTRIGSREDKADPADVARVGFGAMMDGVGDAIARWPSQAPRSTETARRER
jgi:hypothetical protein